MIEATKDGSEVTITMDSGTQHKGFISEKDLVLVRKAIEGSCDDKSISITLSDKAKGGKNDNIQLVVCKIESVNLHGME